MILPYQDTIRVRLIGLFQKHPVLTVADAMKELQKSGINCTIQAVYKELRVLLADNVVQKIGKSYMLNASWVLNLQKFAGQLHRSVFGPDVAPHLLASQGQKQVWTFNNLLELNEFWAHLDLYIVKGAENKNILAWNPYVWFFLFRAAEGEEKFLRSLKMLGGQFCVVVGGDNFLNRIALKFYHRNDVVYSYNPEPFRRKMDTYINVVGDYIVSVKMAKSVHHQMDTVYRTTKSMATLSFPDISDLFMREGRSKLTLEYSPTKAAQLRKTFARHFGEYY